MSSAQGMADPKKTLQESLKNLGVDYVDLYLIHSPFDVDVAQVWLVMEEMVSLGLTKSIGVSNFRIQDLEKVLAVAKIKPFLNQIEYHPYLQQDELVGFMTRHGIRLEAYGPLCPLVHKTDGPLQPVLERLSTKLGASLTQILLQWVIQMGHLVVTTTSKRARMDEIIGMKIELSHEDVQEISSIGKQLDYRKFWVNKY